MGPATGAGMALAADAAWFRARWCRVFGVCLLVVGYSLVVVGQAAATTLIGSPKDVFRMVLPGQPRFNDGGVAVSPDGSLVYVVVHPKNKVYVLSSGGKLEKVWASSWLSGPRGVATDGYGNVYVADQTSGRVVKFSPAGKVIAHWSVREPISIAVAPQGPVYVLRGSSDNRLVEFALNGKKVGGFTANLPGQWPCMCGGYGAYSKTGTVAISVGVGNAGNPIVVGKSDQSLTGTPCAEGTTPVYNYGPCSASKTPPANPLVSGEVVRFSRGGTPIKYGWINDSGGLYWDWYSDGIPTGVAVDPNGGAVYVSDLEERIDYLQPDLTNPDLWTLNFVGTGPVYALSFPCWNCVNINWYNASSPAAVAFDCRSNLYVLEPGTPGVDVFVNQSPPANPRCTPTDLTHPAITGTAQQGDALKGHHGSFLKATGYSYQWDRCDPHGKQCKPVGGATHGSYRLTASDVGHTLRLQVTGRNASGPGAVASSAPTAVVIPPPPANISPPTITGSAVQGQTLTVAVGKWSGSPTSFSYAWEDCDASGANCVLGSQSSVLSPAYQLTRPAVVSPVRSPPVTSSYLLTGADVGSTVRVEVWASNAYGLGGPVSAAPTAVVLPLPPVNTSPPSISGDLTQGVTLTEVPGSWSNSPTGYAVQWESCVPGGGTCTPIAGATGPRLALTASEAGSAIAVLEQAHNAGGASGFIGSPVSAAVAAVGTGGAPAISIAPVIRGQPTSRQTLTGSLGAWQGWPPLTYGVQWQVCRGSSCSNITGATAHSYTIEAPVIAGDTIQVVITATNTQGSSSATSTAVGPVLPPATPPLAIHPPPGGPPPV
jgi:hypothetical protein